MQIANQTTVPIEHRKSPHGKFEVVRKHMSLALGGERDVGPWGGGHPFEVEVTRIPAGKRNYPFHSHAAQTEYYVVLSGTGVVMDDSGTSTPIKPGDHFIFLPGQAHQIESDSNSELEYIVIADSHLADITTYPKTGRRMLKPEKRCILPVDTNYYEDHE